MDISLALGGGGAKGVAHLGVLKALEREGFRMRAIAGTSVGGLVGAVYLCGYSPQEMIDTFLNIDQKKLYGHEAGEEPSLLGLAGIDRIMSEMLGDQMIEELSVPFAVTAVDLNTGYPIVIEEGRLIDAVLATIALPGIFPARHWGDYLLVDGGLINPVPVNAARMLAPNLPVAAVVLNEMHDPNVKLPVPQISGPVPVLNYLSRLRVAQALNVFLRSIDISGRLLTELRLEVDEPDAIIRPDLKGIGLLDEVDVMDLVRRGEAAVEERLEELRRVGSWSYRVAKRLGVKRAVRYLGN